jgi:uncharacterized protein (TIGR02145 family)
MKTNNRFLLATSLVLALAFALSCSNDDNSPQPPKSGGISSSSSYGGSSDSKVLCGNDSYDPSIYRCEMGELIGKCRGNDYYVAYERCIDGVVVNNNSNNNSSSSSIVHSNSSVEPSSSSEAVSSSSLELNNSSSSTQTGAVHGTPVIYGGKTYQTVVIGTQTWFQRNLNYATGNSKCGNGTSLSDANTSTCDTYGRLYNWSTAMALLPSCNTQLCYSQIDIKHQGICPSGWHIPSKEDWNVLMKFVDPSCSDNSNCANAGTKLKAVSGWNAYDGIPVGDDYGFSALPGGFGGSGGIFYRDYVGISGEWWSASEYSQGDTYYLEMRYHNESANWHYGSKGSFFSVRCVKD